MSVGKIRRLKRIFREDGRSVIVPMDHGVTLGPVRGLVNMQEIIDKLVLGGTDGIVLHKGIAKKIETRGMGLITHLSASTDLSSDPLWKVQVCSVAHAVKLGADGISIHVNVGAPREGEMLATARRIRRLRLLMGPFGRFSRLMPGSILRKRQKRPGTLLQERLREKKSLHDIVTL